VNNSISARRRRAWLVLGVCLAAGSCASPRPPSPAAVSDVEADPAPAGATGGVLSTEPWMFETKEGVLIRTPAYRVYTTSDKPGLVERLPGFLEACMAQYTGALTPLPRPVSPIETYVLANRPQWTRLTQRVMGSQADVYLKIQRGGFSANGRALLYDIGPRDTFAIAAHEGWHQFTQTTFRTPLPTSLEEGLATYMEGFRWDPREPGLPIFLPWSNVERFDQLRDAARAGRLMPLPELLRSSPQDLIGEDSEAALTYYAQVWALIHFLREGQAGRHREGLGALLRDAASGELLGRVRREAGMRAASAYATRRQGVDLLKIYLGESSESLDVAYREFVGSITRVGAKARVVQGRSPIE
jgi:hypothetical protein